MRILVIGGTGFIGSRVTARLRAEGHEVAALHRTAVPPDIRAGREELGPGRDFAPEVVVHMIAMAEGHARAAVEAFAGVAGRLVVVSSGDVYRARNRLFRVEPGEPDPVPLGEEAPLRTVLFPYGGDYEKILVERAAAADPRLPATVVRLGMVWGPGDPQNRLGRLQELPEGRCGWRPCRLYVENAAAGIALCATHPAAAGRTYNLADAEVLSEGEFARRAGIAVRIVPETTPLDWSQDWVLDTARIRQELGYRDAVAVDEGIRCTRPT